MKTLLLLSVIFLIGYVVTKEIGSLIFGCTLAILSGLAAIQTSLEILYEAITKAPPPTK